MSIILYLFSYKKYCRVYEKKLLLKYKRYELKRSRQKPVKNPLVKGFRLFAYVLSLYALKAEAGITVTGDTRCIDSHYFNYVANGGGCTAKSGNMGADFDFFNRCVDAAEGNNPGGGEMLVQLGGRNGESLWRKFSSDEMRETPHKTLSSPCEG